MSLASIVTAILTSQAFWVFVGIVAGSFVQYGFHLILMRSHEKNARLVFLAEVAINELELAKVMRSLERKRAQFISGELDPNSFFFDFTGFNYRAVDPLINSGFFHKILGAELVKSYFEFMNHLNVQYAHGLQQLLTEKYEEERAVTFLNHIIDDRAPEWADTIRRIKARLNAKASRTRRK